MAEVTRSARRRAKAGGEQAESLEQNVDAQDEGAQAPEGQGREDGASDGGQPTLTAELKDTIREAAIEVLRPVARKATTSAAKYAVTKGPDLVKDRVAPKIAEAGGAGALAKGVAEKGGGIASAVGGAATGITEKLGGKRKSKAATGTGRGRRLPVQEAVDVGVDIETAYDQFTQFEDWPQFMHRVERVEQRDDTTLMFHENIWGVRRSWEAEIVEQVPSERIVWRSTGELQVVGVVTFHSLSENLTRVQVNMDFQPKGLFEKASSGMRISRRALRSDLMRFKAFVEMRDEATGEWRGRVEDSEVVEPPEQGEEGEGEGEGEEPSGRAEPEDEEREEDYEDEGEEEDEDEPRSARGEDEDLDEDEEPVAEEDYEDEGEEAEEEEEEPARKPAPRRRARPKTPAGTAPRRRR